MREILFRGKRLHDNKWIYGNFVSDCEGNPHIIEPRFFCEDGHHLQYEDNTDTPVFIIPETVGQYTGLTDKNGVKIFEGDILKSTIKIIDCDDEEFSISPYDREDIGIVEWRKDGFMIAHKSGTWARSFYGCENYVIGNIHDNPDILKGGGDNG